MLQELQRVAELIEEGDLVAAQRMCKGLLQQHPTNAAVHEMMGDVMRRRGMWEEAAEWYDLAAQLHETEALKAKRADVLQRAKEDRRVGSQPHLVDDTGTTRRLLIWLGIAAAAMLLVVVGVIWNIADDDEAMERSVVSRDVDTGGPTTRTRPGLTPPSTVPGTRDVPAPRDRPQATPRATANTEQNWAASEMPRRAPRRTVGTRSPAGISTSSPEPTTDHDQSVISAVSSLTWGDNRSMAGRVNAMVEPYSGYAMVSVMIPQTLSADGLVETVVRQAWRVAMATIQADEVITSLTVRMVRVTNDGERVVAFRGNTTRRVLENLNTDRPNFETLWEKVFASTWWNDEAGPGGPAARESGAGNGAS